MVTNPTKLRRSTLYGRDKSITAWSLAISGLLFVISYLFWRLPGISDSAYDFLPVDVIGGGFAALLIIATLQAYFNEGLPISWLLVFLPAFGATVNFVGVGLQSGDPLTEIGLIIGLPVVIALVLGTAGFFVGRSTRFIISSAGAR